MVILSHMNIFVQYVNIFYGNHVHVHRNNIYFVKNVFKCGLKIQINVHFDVSHMKNDDVFNHCYLVEIFIVEILHLVIQKLLERHEMLNVNI